jgi:hypothetical protein
MFGLFSSKSDEENGRRDNKFRNGLLLGAIAVLGYRWYISDAGQSTVETIQSNISKGSRKDV